MPGPKVVWGIDVGQFALRGMKMRLLDGAAEVLAFDVVEYPQILSQPDANADQLLAEAAEKFVSRNDLRGSAVVLGVPGQQTFTRFTKLPPVDPKKINQIVKYEAAQQIPFDIDEVIWDYQIFTTPDSPEVEVGIFAIRRDLVRKYLSVFVNKGIAPVLVQASPLGLYNYLAFDDVPETDAVVILDVGAQNTDLVVARKDGAWTRNIPLGGNNFTEALVKSFKLSFGKAEALKRTAASSRYARQIFQAMRPVFADLVAEIQRSLGYYNSTHRDVEMTKVIGMGNAFKLPGLQKYLQQNLQMEVDKLSTFKKLQFAPGVNPNVFNEYLMSMGVAYGLGIQGLGIGKINNSLLPPEIARTMVWRRKTPWFAGAAAVLLIGGLAIGYSRVRVASALDKCSTNGWNTAALEVQQAQAVIQSAAANAPTGRARAESVLSAAQRLKSEYQTVVATADVGGQLRQIADLYKNRTLWMELMDGLHATLPQPSPEVVAAKTPAEYVAALKKIPRNQRKAIYIDQLDAAYVADTLAAFTAGSISGGDSRGGESRGGESRGGESRGGESRGGDDRRGRGGGGTREGTPVPAAVDEPVKGGGKGFMVIIRGRSPYGASLPEAVVFLSEWVKKLKDLHGQNVQFYVNKIEETPKVFPANLAGNVGITPAMTWVPDNALSGTSGRASLRAGAAPSYGGGGAEQAYRGGGGRAEQAYRGGGGDAEQAYRGGGGDEGPNRGGMSFGTGTVPGGAVAMDPLTGELTSGDYVFQVKLTVALGQPQSAAN